MPEQTKKNRHPRGGKAGRGMLYVMLAIACLIIIFLVALYPVVMVGAPATATIKIERNANADMVRDSLTKYFGKDYTDKVMRLVSLRRADFSKRYGAYEIHEGNNALAAMRTLTSGGQTPVRITINGFRSLPLLVERVSNKLNFPTDSLWRALNDTTLLASYGLKPTEAMALFVDDTYEVFWTATPKDLIKKIGDNYLYLWSETNRRKAADLGLTPAQVMTLASIVDEETNAENEKGIIGRLYINRLNKGMRLQADPTVRFALGDFTIRRVRGEDLKIQSPYNTYLHKGLPPGPIRTPNSKTVADILDSSPNDYLYMCAKEDFTGTHNFATTYDEHTRNALRYQQALDAKGITR